MIPFSFKKLQKTPRMGVCRAKYRGKAGLNVERGNLFCLIKTKIINPNLITLITHVLFLWQVYVLQ